MTGLRRAFEGRSAVVTGAASGIGHAIAAQLAAAGAHVWLTDVDGAAVAAAASELARDAGDRVRAVTLDVRDGAAFDELVATVAREHGSVDLLFNNAGVGFGGESHLMPREVWARVLDVNLAGVINGATAAYPTMVRQGQGHIVNTASGAGLAAFPLTAAYTASKFGVVGLSKALRPEARRHGVRVSVLCPGSVDTPILDRVPGADLPAYGGVEKTGREVMRVLGLTPMPAEVVARRALEGVARDRGIIVVPRAIKALWWIDRLSPATAERVNRRLIRRILAVE